jgi:alpha-L-rhamnosidase
MNKRDAQWIWYPGDFEIWLRREVELRRDERLVVTPPIWRVDSPYVSVRFRKKIRLDGDETVRVVADGMLRLVIDGQMMAHGLPSITLAAGEHDILAEVANTERFPALFVQGETFASDGSWQVSHLQTVGYVSVGCGDFADPLSPPSAFHLATAPVTPQSTQRRDRSLLVDFGKETFGFIRLHDIHGDGEVHLHYGESTEEALDSEHCETYDVVRVGRETTLTTARARALRYVNVVADPGVSVGDVSLLYEYLPLSYRGTFRCSNEMLNNIFDTSLYTLHLNTREFFLDGIKRDRWVWSGDAYQSCLMNYYSFFELPVTQRTLVALRGKDPVEEHLNTILDYSLYWFMALNDYYQYTGDLEFVRRQYAGALGLMSFCVSRANADGFLEGRAGDWVFVDWADMPKEGELSFEQMLFCLSLEAVVRFAGLLGDSATAGLYRPMAARLRRDMRAVFWDAERGALLHRRTGGELDGFITKHPNMFALLYGFLEPEERQRLKHTVMKNPSIPAVKTPYMRFYELAALCEVGEHAYVLNEILDYWGGMMLLGATSFWEEYDPHIPVPEQYAMYGRPYGKSLCHAWGASPIYLLGKYFLGVTPASPGYQQTSIRPHLGGLDWLEGSVPTPHGDVRVFMNRDTLRAFAPGGPAVLQFRSSVHPAVSAGQLKETTPGQYDLYMDQPGQTYEVHFALPS